jgi:transcriptional regulator with XRE-family HTH domain
MQLPIVENIPVTYGQPRYNIIAPGEKRDPNAKSERNITPHLKTLRALLRPTNQEVAEQLNISPRTVEGYYAGKQPDHAVARRIPHLFRWAALRLAEESKATSSVVPALTPPEAAKQKAPPKVRVGHEAEAAKYQKQKGPKATAPKATKKGGAAK